jgi:hypothetical protein
MGWVLLIVLLLLTWLAAAGRLTKVWDAMIGG